MRTAVIFRTSCRPQYFWRSLQHLDFHTSLDSHIIVVVNEPEPHTDAQKILDRVAPERCSTMFFGERLGGPRAINEGVAEAIRLFPKVEFALVVDDDTYVPLEVDSPPEVLFWDQALTNMLDAGWNIAGHPWSHDFVKSERKTVGNVEGIPYGHVAGTCSGFHVSEWKRRPLVQRTLIHGYTNWQRGHIGYWCSPVMPSVHFDRPEHPHSLRDTDYRGWSDDMYYERFPDRRRPDHSAHKRPLGQGGAW